MDLDRSKAIPRPSGRRHGQVARATLRNMRRRNAYLIFLLTLAIFALLFLYPLGMVIKGGFFDENGHFTLRFVTGVFQNPVYAEGLLNSVLIAIGTTLLVTLFSVPLSLLATRYDFPGK